jgi:DNA-binding LacI/PurR family transcriptional regulator
MNNSPLVNEETHKRIMAVVKELGYRPDPVARRLSIGKTLAVAVIVPFFTRPSVSERLNGAISLLSQTEYDLVIHNIETAEQYVSCFNKIPDRRQADGVLIISLSPADEETQQLAEADVPIVMIDADHPALTMLHRVTVDDIEGGRRATEHLINLGHRRIGFIGDIIENPFNFGASRDRFLGYRQALEEAGIPYQPKYYAENQHGRQEAHESAKRILSLDDRPTAIFAASDTQAVGVLQAARCAGLRVPEDLSVIGYDDIEVADILSLTTIRQMLFESGRLGVELLLEALEHPDMEPVHTILPTELVVRGTTAAVA